MSDLPLVLHVFDVGHGESILLEFPDGYSFGIVDCHKKHRDDVPPVKQFLIERADAGLKTEVLFAALTHPDLDHVRGYADVLRSCAEREIPIRAFWNSQLTDPWAQALHDAACGPNDIDACKELIHLVEEVEKLTNRFRRNHMYVQSMPLNQAWRGPADIRIEFLAPNASIIQRTTLRLLTDDVRDRRRLARRYGAASNINLASSAFLVHYGQGRILLSGDLLNEAWEIMLHEEGVHTLKAQILKVPHHGSVHSNFPRDEPLCAHVIPEDGDMVAAVSGGYQPKLPHVETIASLRDREIPVVITGHCTEEVRKLFVPSTGDRHLDQRLSEELGLVELYDEFVPEYGDIQIECYPDGRWSCSSPMQPSH